MEKNLKLTLAGIAIIAVIALAYFFLAPADFESEFKRMGLAWKENGIAEPRLHAADEVFALDEESLASIKNGLNSFKASSRNAAATELAAVYLDFADFAIAYRQLENLTDSLPPLSENAVCSNAQTFEKISNSLAEMREKKEAYLEGVNEFVSSHPEEADSIKLVEVEASEEDTGFELLLSAAEALAEGC